MKGTYFAENLSVSGGGGGDGGGEVTEGVAVHFTVGAALRRPCRRDGAREEFKS